MKNDAERGSLMKSDTDIPCVQLSTEQQATAIEAACKAANLDAHITRITAKSRAATWAEKLAVRFKLDRADLVVKNSYMYCDALDMCFFFLNGRTPAFAYAGYTVVRSADANGGLVKAFAKADEVLRYMAEYQEKEAATQ